MHIWKRGSDDPIRRKKQRWFFVGCLALALGLWYYFSLPDALFDDPASSVLEDHEGGLLSASIAADGQWRFPQTGLVPDKFQTAIVLYEDKRFEHHPGVDLLSIARATRQNLVAGKIVSGGSTLSMQVIRLSRKGKTRTIFEKITEIILATRLEFRYSKKEILGLYAAHAPFGGNVVGIDAACWRYFGRSAHELGWAEAALLAVLPNNPSLLHPGKNRLQLKAKRDRLLRRLHAGGAFGATALDLAMAEEIPERPLTLPTHAHHLLHRIGVSKIVRSTIDAGLQQRAEQIVADHHERLKGNQVFNAAVLVVDVKTGDVLAYVGNTEAGNSNQGDVDIVTARRSTGSILKPFLFAAMLDDGKMLPKTLNEDVPTIIQGFNPKNFSRQYDGAVAADQALIRSLNVPFVHQLREFRYERFHSLLQNLGLTTLNHPADHYGLTLILGGAETTLWDITGVYASMARTLNNYFEHPGGKKYDPADFHPLRYVINGDTINKRALEESSLLSASSIWLTFESLKEVYRPGEETGWRHFNSAKKIAWKTGTSLGFKDAWAIGVNPDYAVGVWVGNADGEGRPGLVGTETAAPILFDIFSFLPGHSWFSQPSSEMTQVATCSKSGQRASLLCVEKDTIWVGRPGLHTTLCRFHKLVHLTKDSKFRLHADCASLEEMTAKSWFVLPPIQEYYYRSRNVTYKALPPFRPGCVNPASLTSMDIIYPRPNSRIFVPRDLDGSLGKAVFQVAHRTPTATIFWHLDGNFIATTSKSHHLAMAPTEGNHILTLVDDKGETIERSFSVISRQ